VTATPSILVLGNANVDLVLGEIDGWPRIGTEIRVERAEMRAGGSAGNSALALAGMGVPHRLVASTGSDPNGAWLRGAFDAASCAWIDDDGATTLTVGIVHKGGDRAFLTTPGHLDTARVEDIVARLPAAPPGPAFALISGGFLMPGIRAGTDDLLDALAGRGWRTAIDPGWPPEGWREETLRLMEGWLARADVALLNEVEVRAIAGKDETAPAAELLAARLEPRRILVVKQGEKGASAWQGSRHFHAAAPKVRVIDTVGAGDTFNAGFLAALTKGAGPAAALAKGVQAASRAVSTSPRCYGP
jgi:sugar/nucleoside kinase (ribokinase family)